ncbi:MAG TPA: hypothetical protein DCO71_01740 [Gammaproteobacteria bacterium]|nr:hypothetical protein [Gammaproteobacteria bacterium]
MKSIQNRLAIWLLTSVVILFGLHWLVTSRAPDIFTREYIATRLEHDGEALLSGISFTAAGMPVLDPDYAAPIYSRPGSGHYYLLQTNGYHLKSASLGKEDFGILPAAGSHETLFEMQGPGGQPILAHMAHFEKAGYRINLLIAEELTSLNQDISKFRIRFLLVTLAILGLLIFVQRMIVRLSLRPLDTMSKACRQLENGDISKFPEDVPLEVKPLVTEINRLVELSRKRLIRSRNSLGNLAHGLKTPLAVLGQLIDQDAGKFSPEDLQQAKASVAMIQSIIDRELKQARLAGPTSAGQLFHLNEELPDLLGLLEQVYTDKKLQYELVLEREDIRFGDREDMLELIGNLLDNASKWGLHKVRFSAHTDGGLTILVEDDGPGIETALQASLMQRGTRLDESSSGHGLGLSIIQEIVTQYAGVIDLSRSSALGGLQVRIFLPELG